jgi:hypothetical protein
MSTEHTYNIEASQLIPDPQDRGLSTPSIAFPGRNFPPTSDEYSHAETVANTSTGAQLNTTLERDTSNRDPNYSGRSEIGNSSEFACVVEERNQFVSVHEVNARREHQHFNPQSSGITSDSENLTQNTSAAALCDLPMSNSGSRQTFLNPTDQMRTENELISATETQGPSILFNPSQYMQLAQPGYPMQTTEAMSTDPAQRIYFDPSIHMQVAQAMSPDPTQQIYFDPSIHMQVAQAMSPNPTQQIYFDPSSHMQVVGQSCPNYMHQTQLFDPSSYYMRSAINREPEDNVTSHSRETHTFPRPAHP